MSGSVVNSCPISTQVQDYISIFKLIVLETEYYGGHNMKTCGISFKDSTWSYLVVIIPCQNLTMFSSSMSLVIAISYTLLFLYARSLCK